MIEIYILNAGKKTIKKLCKNDKFSVHIIDNNKLLEYERKVQDAISKDNLLFFD